MKIKTVSLKIFRAALIFMLIMTFFTAAVYYMNFGIRVNTHRTITADEARISHFYSGANRLTAYIFGEQNDKGLIVVSHGIGGGAVNYLWDINYFVSNGWRVFAFDKTGSHNSEGRGTRGLPQSAIDLNAALNYVESKDSGLPIMLYGHSWGGFAVAAVLNFEHDIRAVVSLDGYAESMEMLHEGAVMMLGPFGFAAYPFMWVFQRILFGEYADLSAVDGINNVTVPVLVTHNTANNLVTYDGTGIIAQRDRMKNPNVIFDLRRIVDFTSHSEFITAANEFFTEQLY